MVRYTGISFFYKPFKLLIIGEHFHAVLCTFKNFPLKLHFWPIGFLNEDLLIYLFLTAGSLLLYAGFLQLQRAGLLSSEEHGLLTAVVSLGEQRVQCAGSVAVAPGLDCPTARGIVPHQGSNGAPCPARRILDPWTTRETRLFFQKYIV